MMSRHLNQQSKLSIICDQLYQATQNFLDSANRKNCFSYIFKQKSEEEKIATALQDIIENVTARMSFPQLSYFEENQLLEQLNQCYKKLSVLFTQNLNKKRSDSQFCQFFSSLQSCLQDIVKLFSPHINKVDLKYLDYYIEDRDFCALEQSVSFSNKKNVLNDVMITSQRLFYQKIQDSSRNKQSVNDRSYMLKI